MPGQHPRPNNGHPQACTWFAEQDQAWLDRIGWATLDLSGPWRLAFTTMLPAAVQVADPFHVVKLANQHREEPPRGQSQAPLGSGLVPAPDRGQPRALSCLS
ncbi:MAG: transposase [Actinomycetia bacterium]|nr:transposase [Actinomycetes bacterium]